MSQLLWLTLLAAQATLAGVWWWLMPHGFPSSSSAFWVNEVGPPIIVVLCALAVLPPRRLSAALFPALTASLLAFWMALAISARLTFPRSVGFSWNVTFLAGCALAALWWRQLRPRLSAPWLVPALVLPALLLGWAFPATQRVAEASTRPLGAPIAELPPGGKASGIVKLDKQTQVHPDKARIVVRRDALVLTIDPLLTFTDRSPEATWVSLDPEDATPTVRKLLASQTGKGHVLLEYADEDRSLLDVATRGGALEIEARSRLAQPVYAHLDEWTLLTVRGGKAPSIVFSTAPERRIDVPLFGAPTRFAYVDAGSMLHVAEAHEHEKGPFRELARGALTGALTVSIYDGDKLAYRVALADWAAQASTAASPTAGDGIPVNDIEFAHATRAADSPIYVVFSLAATSIGRGWQSVGHAAGVYRNRMTVTTP